MTMNREGRPTTPTESAGAGEFATFTGNRALQVEEPLLFETGSLETSGVDLPEPESVKSRLGGLERNENIGLPFDAGLFEHPLKVRPRRMHADLQLLRDIQDPVALSDHQRHSRLRRREFVHVLQEVGAVV